MVTGDGFAEVKATVWSLDLLAVIVKGTAWPSQLSWLAPFSTN
jgi:hypothetical protein